MMATFAGCVYVCPVNDAGREVGGWEFLGQVAPMSLQLQDEEPQTIKSRCCDDFGQVIATKPVPGTASGSLTMFDYTAHNVAKVLKGMVETVSDPPAPMTDEEFTFFEVGQYTSVGREGLLNVTVKDASDNVLVAGTDYSINPRMGLIAPKTERLANQTFKISATFPSIDSTRVVIGGAETQYYAIKCDQVNEFDGNRSKVHLKKVLFNSSAETVIVSEDGTEREGIQLGFTPQSVDGSYGVWDGLPLRVVR